MEPKTIGCFSSPHRKIHPQISLGSSTSGCVGYEGNKVLLVDINLKQLCLFLELGFGAFPPAFQSLVEGVVWFAFETNVGQSKNILSTWGPAASLWQRDHSAGSCWIVLSNQTGADRFHHPMNGPSDRTGSAGLSGLSA